MAIWKCASSNLMVSSISMPEEWVKLEIEKDDGTKTSYTFCSIWQAADFLKKMAYN